MNQKPMIRVWGFRTTYEKRPVKGDPKTDKLDVSGYKLDASGHVVKELTPEVWVIYSPAHSPRATQNVERVRFLMPDADRVGDDPDGVKLEFLNTRWEQIRPAYEAYMSGQEIPVNGTALASWSGVTPEQADVLKVAGIRTVEDVRDLSDSSLQTVGLPRMRELRDQARLFLENSDAARAAEREAEKDAQIKALVERMEAMQAVIDDLSTEKKTGGKKEAA